MLEPLKCQHKVRVQSELVKQAALHACGQETSKASFGAIPISRNAGNLNFQELRFGEPIRGLDDFAIVSQRQFEYQTGWEG